MKSAKKRHRVLPRLEVLHQLFTYYPLTGDLVSKKTGHNYGANKRSKYLRLTIEGQGYMLHRIVFKMYHQRDPKEKVVDHINGNTHDNRITNLRACSHGDNVKNTAKSRKSGKVPKPPRGCGRVYAKPITTVKTIEIDPTPLIYDY